MNGEDIDASLLYRINWPGNSHDGRLVRIEAVVDDGPRAWVDYRLRRGRVIHTIQARFLEAVLQVPSTPAVPLDQLSIPATKIIEVADMYGARHNMCEVLDNALAELGIVRPKRKIRVMLEIDEKDFLNGTETGRDWTSRWDQNRQVEVLGLTLTTTLSPRQRREALKSIEVIEITGETSQ